MPGKLLSLEMLLHILHPHAYMGTKWGKLIKQQSQLCSVHSDITYSPLAAILILALSNRGSLKDLESALAWF